MYLLQKYHHLGVHILKVKKYLPGADVTLPKAFKFSFGQN
jgi:hypothetical protein